MKHLIQYHKVWEEGNPLSNPKPYVFTTNIKTKQNLVENAWFNSERVWLIYRTDKNSSNYYIGYTFDITDIEENEDKLEMFGEPSNVLVQT